MWRLKPIQNRTSVKIKICQLYGVGHLSKRAVQGLYEVGHSSKLAS